MSSDPRRAYRRCRIGFVPVPSERLVNRIRRDFSPDRAEEVAGWLTVAAEAAIGEVIATGEAILTRLAAVSRGGGRVVMTTVYDPSDGTGKVASAGLPPWPEGPALVRALNAALTDLAQRHSPIPGPPTGSCGAAE